jgi:dTDP-4-dehydrorhamnose reductase
MKILLLGANGQVGWELRRSLAPLGEIRAYGRHTANLQKLDDLSRLIREFSPDAIVNAAAYTSVDKAESELEQAFLVNSRAVDFLAKEAKLLNSWFIHYSTDYVFDGLKNVPYTETDTPNPQSVYGQTKYDGENSIKESNAKHLIFRTTWVYSKRGNNFLKSIIRLAKKQDELRVVCDQVGVPTSAELIADVTALCLYNIAQYKDSALNLSGTYNLTPTGETSWHGFAQFIIAETLGLGDNFRTSFENIQAISTSDYPLPAKRPSNSLLDTKKICNTFNVSMPPWQTHVERLLKELYSQE